MREDLRSHERPLTLAAWWLLQLSGRFHAYRAGTGFRGARADDARGPAGLPASDEDERRQVDWIDATPVEDAEAFAREGIERWIEAPEAQRQEARETRAR